MSQKEIEVILTRHLASYLATPIFVVDPQGSLLFYNEPAEVLLGKRFDETGEMSREELAEMFKPLDDSGQPLPPEEVPVVKAMLTREPTHRTLWIKGGDGQSRHINATAFPLIGQGGLLLGGVAIMWEQKAPSA